MRKRTRSIAKGAVAGLIGGILATAVKSAVEKAYPPQAHGEPKPSALLDRKIAGHELSLRQKQIAQTTLHWSFGAAAGAAYGAVAEYYPPATSKQGASFGIALVALTHDNTLPIFGSIAKPEAGSTRERSSELASNIAYGIVTETVRSIVRRLLD
jgi:putative membrane protein